MPSSTLKGGPQWTDDMHDRLRASIWSWCDANNSTPSWISEDTGHQYDLINNWINKKTKPELPALVDVSKQIGLSFDHVFFGEARTFIEAKPLKDWKDRIRVLLAEDYRHSGYSLAPYAARLGSTHPTIQKWIDGRANIPRDGLIALLKRTGVSADWLIYGIGEKYRDGRTSA